MARLRIDVAKSKCRSFGKCMSVAPELFAFDDEKKVRVIESGAASDETIAKAAKGCPYRVITLVDEDTGEQVFPPVRKPPPVSSS
jgi:ferredoxin